MRKILKTGAALLFALVGTSAAVAQHAGHQMPAGSPADAAASACIEHSRQSLLIIDRVNRRLEESRQSNNPTKMRAAMDELQAALGELRTHQSLCVSAAEAKSSESAKPGSSPGMEMMDHSKMGHEMSMTPPKKPAQPAKTPTPRKPDGQ